MSRHDHQAENARRETPRDFRHLLQVRAALALAILAVFAWTARTWFHADSENPGGFVPRDLTIVVRTPRNLADPSQISQLVERLYAAGVSHVLLQYKQDETDEHLGGVVFYPSALAPVADGYEDDRLGGFLQALHARGIRVSAWMPMLHDPSAGSKRPEWRAWWINAEGVPEDQTEWLCPRAGEAIAYQSVIAAEIHSRYPLLSGLYIDFIRYDSDLSCVCDRCLRDFDQRIGWKEEHGTPLRVDDIRAAADALDDTWEQWITMRAESVCTAVEAVRDRIDEVRPNVHLGACVLPFSATDYAFNTQSGQDLYEMARVGLDEIVLMGYWDDWAKSPQWLEHSIAAAHELVAGECTLSCLIDADMPPRRTLLTLDAVARQLGALEGGFLGFFQYGTWDKAVSNHVRAVVDRTRAQDSAGSSTAKRPDKTRVVIRVDTEPDYLGSYESVSPAMIRALMDMFESERVRATFITCGRLAELQPEVILEAVRRGHEIGSHAYDHEQLDSLNVEAQMAAIDKSMMVFKSMGVECIGFGAPRNSITRESRDRLIEHGLLYDGSDSYDPMHSLIDPYHVSHSEDVARGDILVIPFIFPNDWDARHVQNLTAQQMLEAWKDRLDRVIDMGEPCFVLDVHQWLASEQDNLSAVREFIRYAKSQPRVEMTTLKEAAWRTERFLEQFESMAAERGERP